MRLFISILMMMLIGSNIGIMYAQLPEITNKSYTKPSQADPLQSPEKPTVWQRISVAMPDNFRAVFFDDEQTGWVLCEYYYVLKTEDGGDNWSVNITGAKEQLYGIWFTDKNNGWLCAAGGMLYKTEDGGANWTPNETETYFPLKKIIFVDSLYGWTCGLRGTILFTSDGGANWSYQVTQTTSEITSIFFVDRNRGWAVGEAGTIFRTEDGGANWEFIITEIESKITSVYFLNQDYGWLAGNNGLFYHSSDGGKSWTNMSIDKEISVTDFHFVNARHGWLICPWMMPMRTTNGGIDWFEEAVEGSSSNALTDIFFIKENRGWAVGLLGALFRTVSIDNAESGAVIANDAIGIFPNPASDKLNITVSLEKQEFMELVIFEPMNGRIMTIKEYSWFPDGSNEIAIDVNHLPSGIYCIAANKSSGTLFKIFSICR